MTVDIENSVVKFSFLYCPVVSFNCNVGAELKQWVFWVALLNQMSILESKSASVPPWRAGRMHKLCLRGKSGQPRASGGSSDRCQLHPPSLEGTGLGAELSAQSLKGAAGVLVSCEHVAEVELCGVWALMWSKGWSEGWTQKGSRCLNSFVLIWDVFCVRAVTGQKALEGRWVRGMAKTGKNVWCHFSLRTNRKKSKLETTSEHPKAFARSRQTQTVFPHQGCVCLKSRNRKNTK